MGFHTLDKLATWAEVRIFVGPIECHSDRGHPPLYALFVKLLHIRGIFIIKVDIDIRQLSISSLGFGSDSLL